jgi:hypothetical protein
MRMIYHQVLITPRHFPRPRARIGPLDQRAAIRPGISLTHYAFTTPQGQPGYVIISHAAQRAGICGAVAPPHGAGGVWRTAASSRTPGGSTAARGKRGGSRVSTSRWRRREKPLTAEGLVSAV